MEGMYISPTNTASPVEAGNEPLHSPCRQYIAQDVRERPAGLANLAQVGASQVQQLRSQQPAKF